MDKSIETILIGLTEPQREAVLHQGSPLLIIAGPGSGKTRVIAAKVAYLVRSGSVEPENVLAVTFTEKAAAELKDRVQSNLPDVNVERMQVSTVHSFCAELLRRYRPHSAFPKGFRILDENGQFLIVYSNRKSLGLAEIIKAHNDDLYDRILRAFNLATEEMVPPEKFLSWCKQRTACSDKKENELCRERETVAQAYQRYCDLLTQRNLVDFAFLQRHAHDLLSNNLAVLSELRSRYQAILVDEYQDTNAIQEKLFLLLAGDGHNLTVVGDDDQGIYRFRGATVKNIDSFPEKFANTRKITLNTNFRSRDQIVDLTQQVIVHNPARFAKDLVASRGPGSEVLLLYKHSVAEEAIAVVDLIHSLLASKHIKNFGDVVILLRSVRSYAATYSEALGQASIPCLVIGDANLFEKDGISQLYNLFNFLGTAKEWGDRYVRQPLVGLSDASREALKAYRGNLLDLDDEKGLKTVGVASTKDAHCLLQLLELKRKVLEQKHDSALGVFYGILVATGYFGRLELAGDILALKNLGIFSNLVAAWDENGSTNNFYPFREYLELLREGGVDPALPPADNAVQIMTIHQAKGLEFPVVFVCSALDGRLPSTRRSDPYEVPCCLRASGNPEVNDPHLVDERKLFYVATTRARDLLIAGTADVVNKRGGGPSPFLKEMFGDDLHKAASFSEEQIREIISRKPSENQPRPRYNFSQVAYYLQCPVRYKYSVVYDLATPWLDPVDFGANVHRCLEAIHLQAMTGKYITRVELPALVDDAWLSTSRSTPELEEVYRKAAIKQLNTYISKHGDRLVQTFQSETSFSSWMANSVVTGKIDLIRKTEDGRMEIVDFKSSGSGPDEIEQAELQLSMYALGLESYIEKPVACLSVHFLKDDQVITWQWDESRKKKAENTLGDLFGRIEQQDFPPRKTYCTRCMEFRDICPYKGGKA